MFKVAAILVGVLNLMMGAVWVFAPRLPLELWGVAQTSQDAMVERRLGVVLMIYSLVLLFSRNAPPSPARSAISYSVIVGGLAVGSMNIYDLLYSQTSSGMATSIGINFVTSLAFALIEWRTRIDLKLAETD